MSQPDLLDSPDAGHVAGWGSPPDRADAPTATELVAAAVRARHEDWSAAVTADPGDAHDKGEDSLCVGEAA